MFSVYLSSPAVIVAEWPWTVREEDVERIQYTLKNKYIYIYIYIY